MRAGRRAARRPARSCSSTAAASPWCGAPGTTAKPILRLEGCTSREDAEALRGSALVVPVDEAPPLEEGEFWAHDLVGCTVVDGEREVGVVDADARAALLRGARRWATG